MKVGLFNDVLGGIASVGQIAQLVNNAVGQERYVHEESGDIIETGFNLGPIHFYKGTLNGSTGLFAMNRTSNQYAQVCSPGDVSGNNAFSISLNANQTSPIDLFDPSMLANTPIHATPATVPAGFDGVEGGSGPLFNLAIKNLKIGSLITVSGFTLRCTTTQLFILPISLLASYKIIQNLRLITPDGNGVDVTRPLEPTNDGFETMPSDGYEYAINFSEFGIDPQSEPLSGSIALTTDGSSEVDWAEVMKEVTPNSVRELRPSEIEYAKLKGIIIK